jgi:citrate lyase subunit beta/citryl-CoA lyase
MRSSHSTRPQPNWRSLMFVPVLAERFVAKAHTRGADAIILDLEDSIIPANKAAAREAIAAAVPRVSQAGADVVVRINRPLDLVVPDIAASVMPGVSALMLPKVMGPEHVRLLAELVTDREAALGMEIGHTRFLVLIEEPAALPHLFAIAREPRMAGMSVGGEDMATELGATPSADSMYVFAMQGLAACRAAGILPMGSMGQLANINDLESYRAGLKRGRGLGFTTATCIHPAHVPIINEEYGASEAELDHARRLLVAFDAAVKAGEGAVAFEGKMIDLPIVIRAQRLLERAASWKKPAAT